MNIRNPADTGCCRFPFPDDLILQDTNLDIKGNQVLQVPEYKGSAFTVGLSDGERGDLL